MGTESPFAPGEVVVSMAGRDKGKMYVVLSLEGDRYVRVADGLVRTARKPKRKNVRHLAGLGRAKPEVIARLSRGRLVEDELLRRVISDKIGSLEQGEKSVERG